MIILRDTNCAVETVSASLATMSLTKNQYCNAYYALLAMIINHHHEALRFQAHVSDH